MKLKTKPSEKIKRRYILIKKGSKKDIEKAILDYIGILGWAKAKPVFVKSKGNVKGIILSVDRKELDNIKASFAISKKNIEVERVSGTIKGLQKK